MCRSFVRRRGHDISPVDGPRPALYHVSMMRATVIGMIALIVLMISCGRAVAKPQPVTAPATPGVRKLVFLVTFGQGDDVWEKFGHSVIRIAEADDRTRIGTDQAYNWGEFDFDAPNFLGHFVMGKMTYQMGARSFDRFYYEYRKADRQMRVQRLDLSPAQLERLEADIRQNLRPENVNYRYDYFIDNCSTRVRDALDHALGGQLRASTAGLGVGPSYRWQALRLMQSGFLISSGADFALGRPCDRGIDAWDAMFLPGALADAVETLKITDETNPAPRPLVTARAVEPSNTRPPEAGAPPARWLTLALIGLAWAGAALWLFPRGRWARRGATMLLVLWSILASIGGVVASFLWLFTDHVAAYRNENLVLYSPLSMLMIVLLPPAVRYGTRSRPGRIARPLSLLLAGLTIVALAVKLLPGPAQNNGGWILLAVIMHGATAWAITIQHKEGMNAKAAKTAKEESGTTKKPPRRRHRREDENPGSVKTTAT